MVFIECGPGDVVLFSNLIFHSGSPNHSDAIRWSIDWCGPLSVCVWGGEKGCTLMAAC